MGYYDIPDAAPKAVCPECDSGNVDTEEVRHGKYKWLEFECQFCGHKWSEEPDWDNMFGGKDYGR